MPGDGVSLKTRIFDYDQKLAREIIRYVFGDLFGKSGATEDYRQAARNLLIEFRDRNLLYSPTMYDEIDGDYEFVDLGDLQFLLTHGKFYHLDSLRPLEFDALKVRSTQKAPPGLTKKTPPISVIVPVFGNLRNTYHVSNEIAKLMPELRELGGRVLIAIDGHDTPIQTAQHLELLECLATEDVAVFSHKRNLGFIENVNFLFDQTRAGEIVVLLTTDVHMQPYTITRVIAPLIADARVALSTPFGVGGENLEAPKSDLLHWRDLDLVLSELSPTYPDAETNVGYLLAVDRRKYRGERLFDSFFDNGYGDDSDLYYRCVNFGYRGVVADNCCVLHEHGSSFAHTDQRSILRTENHRRFMERWGEIHLDRREVATRELERRKNDLARVSNLLRPALEPPQVVFVLPTNDRRIGGVFAVFDIAEALSDVGVPTAVLSFHSPQDETHLSFKSVSMQDLEKRDALLADASWVIATSHDTCDSVKYLAKSNKCHAGYFVQGPEFSFSDGAFLRHVVTGYEGFDAVFAVSRYLERIVQEWIDGPVHLVPYGPARYRYFETGKPRQERSIAVQLNGNNDKGAAYVAGVIAALVKKGYKFHSFGDEKLRGVKRNFCNHLGFLSTAEKVKLFNSVEFYLDASNFEGLGLILMESSRCGAIPIYRHNGGSADLLKAAGAGIEVGDYAAIGQVHEQLTAFRDQARWEAERKRCEHALRDHSLEAAVMAMKDWWVAQS